MFSKYQYLYSFIWISRDDKASSVLLPERFKTRYNWFQLILCDSQLFISVLFAPSAPDLTGVSRETIHLQFLPASREPESFTPSAGIAIVRLPLSCKLHLVNLLLLWYTISLNFELVNRKLNFYKKTIKFLAI